MKKISFRKLTFPLILVLLFAFVAYNNLSSWADNNSLLDQQASNDFYWDSSDSLNVISKRMEVYADTLYSLRGLFAINNSLPRNRFETFVNSINTSDRYPGTLATSYVQFVKDADVPAFINDMKTDTTILPQGYPNVKMFPANNNETHDILKFIVPYAGNENILGYDISTDQVRRDIVQSTIDSGVPTASPPVQVIQDKDSKDKIISYGINLAIYKYGADISTTELKRANAIGMVSFTFRIKELMSNMFGSSNSYPSLGFQIYDSSVSDANLVYTRDNYQQAKKGASMTKELDMAGRKWIFKYYAGDSYTISPINANLLRTRLFNGIALNVLILMVLGYFIFGRGKQTKK